MTPAQTQRLIDWADGRAMQVGNSTAEEYAAAFRSFSRLDLRWLCKTLAGGPELPAPADCAGMIKGRLTMDEWQAFQQRRQRKA